MVDCRIPVKDAPSVIDCAYSIGEPAAPQFRPRFSSFRYLVDLTSIRRLARLLLGTLQKCNQPSQFVQSGFVVPAPS